MVDPKVAEVAEKWDVGIPMARLIIKERRQAGRTPETRRGPGGGKRRAASAPLRKAILKYVKDRPGMTPRERKSARLKIAKKFDISTRTVARHTKDLMEEYVT